MYEFSPEKKGIYRPLAPGARGVCFWGGGGTPWWMGQKTGISQKIFFLGKKGGRGGKKKNFFFFFPAVTAIFCSQTQYSGKPKLRVQ